MEAWVTSRYLTILDVEAEWSFLSHAVFGNRRVYDRALADIVRLFETPRTSAQALRLAMRRSLLLEIPESTAFLDQFVAELLEADFLVRAGTDEVSAAAKRLRETWGRDLDRAFGLDAIEDLYAPALPSRLEDRLRERSTQEPVSFLLLGWCFTQSVKPILVEEARKRGLTATVEIGFQDDLHLIQSLQPDAVLLQLSHRQILAPVLDGFHRRPIEDLEDRIVAACDAIRHAIGRALEACTNRLLMVQGIAAPQTSPLGVLDAKHQVGFFETIHLMNRVARESIATAPNALFVDEEALLSSFGKRYLLDDLVSTYSHHGILAFEPGPTEGTNRIQSFGLTDRMALHRLLARAYLDLYEIYRGREAIRLIAVDLDGTLWPGLIGEGDFRFNSDALAVPLMYGRFGGLHEALQILRDRGILLAVVSKNNLSEVLQRWTLDNLPLALGVQSEEVGHYLGPDHFVRVSASWEPKSVQLRRLAQELGVTPAQIAFIDDNPVEREEVRQALPEVLLLGEDMNRVRETLLTSPRFQVLRQTPESRRRTETTKARLQREDAAKSATDHQAFLASLDVRCRVHLETDQEHVQRITELLTRTNQFNTTALRLDTQAVSRLSASQGLLTLEVEDRFSSYGLVGVAVVEGAQVSCFALSCRVIGLEVDGVLLRAALELAGQTSPEVRIPFLPTDRNLPATRLFTRPGFELLPGGEAYRYDLKQHPLLPWPAHCAVTQD